MPKVELFVSDKDFIPNKKAAKCFIEFIQKEHKINEKEIAIVQRSFHQVAKAYRKKYPPLARIFGLKNQRLHDIDTFFAMKKRSYHEFVDSIFFDIRFKGIILAHLIQENCQPENYVRIQHATWELLKYQKALDPYQEPSRKEEMRRFLEVGFKMRKAQLKGARSTSARKQTGTVRLEGAIKNKPRKQWTGAVAGEFKITKDAARKKIQRYLIKKEDKA